MRASIQEFSQGIKRFLGGPELFPVLLILLVGVTSFGLGRLAERGSGGLAASVGSASLGSVVPQEVSLPPAQGYVASRWGSRYHLPWCSGAERILEENRVYFETQAEAEEAGYTPAANCPGM